MPGADPSHNEKVLLDHLRAGDEAAFSEIYRQYWERLFFMAHKRLQSAQDAKEIIQNVFLTLWLKRHELSIQSLPLYLGAMTRYAVYRHLGNAKRRDFQMQEMAGRTKGGITDAIDLDNKQLLDILAKLSNELPEKYRLVFIHHKLLDRPLEEVARQLGVSPRTAEAYVAKVMQIMRDHREKLGALAILLGLY